ncbi:hypothetical protein WJX81_000272 [Elliptochloris bilobata]|uniref:DUF202 domain-containing protein n=1 Tax=Elliptochloris bilobata TaxID=381761 RepID=A0AAW1QZ50_9CHLO
MANAANGAQNHVIPQISDALFGTRSHTAGARYQVPRKVPLRIEPKTFFANERTFLSWVSMAITIGGVTTALVGFQSEGGGGHESGPIMPGTTDLITILLTPVAIAMVIYALFCFYWRSVFLRKKQMGFYNDYVGPAVLCGLVMLVLSVIMVVAFIEVLAY